MDFNLKGKFFPGNIYHQFESICRDVDEFVTKDTLKFVENRVQSVGMTVKRFYTNVVEDILPLSEDGETPKSQLVDDEQVDMQNQVSVTGINTNSTFITEKQVFLNQGSIHTLGDSDASLPVELDHKTEISEPPCGDLSPGEETSLQGSESGVEEDNTRDSIPVTTDSCLESLDNNVFSGVSNEDHKHSAPTLAHEVDLTTVKEETQHFDHKRQISEPACEDLSPGEETSLQGAESGVEEDITWDSKPVTSDSCLESLESNIFSGVSNEDHKHSAPTPAHEVDLTTVKEETQHFDHKMQISEPACGDLSPGAETSLQGEESGVEEDITTDSKPVTTVSCLESLDNNVFSAVSNEDHKHSTPTPAHEVDLTTFKEETNQKGNKSDLYDPECFCDSSINGKLALNEENRYFDENGSFSSPSVSSANKVNEDNSRLMDSPLPSAFDADASALVKDREKSSDFTTKDDNIHVLTSVKSPPECVLSHFSWKEKEAETGNTPRCCCVMESTSADYILKTENICPVHSKCDGMTPPCCCVTESTSADSILGENICPLHGKRDGMTPHCCCVTESTSADYILKTENICPFHSKRDGLAVNISAPSLVTAPDETKDVDVRPSIPILKSNELVNASSDRHKQHHKDGHSEMLMSPSETANTCGDFDMETIDLSSDLKDNGIIPVSQSSCVHAASRRRSFRYYKNLIHDAFTSQKRISKEYEHLAILHTDIDMESNQHFLNTNAVKTQSSEWELI